MSKLSSALGALILVVVQNPIIGRARQSLANNTFTTYKGLNVLKAKPFSVANPRTPAQVAQREAMTFMVALYRALKPIWNVGFKQVVDPLSPYNWFVQNNVPAAVDTTTPGSPVLVPANFVASKGTLPNTAIATATGDVSDDEMVVTWDPTLDYPDWSNTDKAYCMIYNMNLAQGAGFSAGTVNRSTGTLTIPAGGDLTAGDVLAVYLFFLSADGLTVSDSQYVSATVTA